MLPDKKTLPHIGCEIKLQDEELLICRCEEVTRAEILQAIAEGACTLDEIKRRTRAGMGLCQAKTCLRSLEKILSEVTGQAIADMIPWTTRPPVRPIPLGVLANLVDDDFL